MRRYLSENGCSSRSLYCAQQSWWPAPAHRQHRIAANCRLGAALHLSARQKKHHLIPAAIISVRYLPTGMCAFHLSCSCTRLSGCGDGGGEIRGFLSMPGGAHLRAAAIVELHCTGPPACLPAGSQRHANHQTSLLIIMPSYWDSKRGQV